MLEWSLKSLRWGWHKFSKTLSWLQGRKEWVELNSQATPSLPVDEEHACATKTELMDEQAEQQTVEAMKQSDQAKQMIVQVSEMPPVAYTCTSK